MSSLSRVVLQHQRLQLRVSDDVLEVVNQTDHLQDLRGLPPGALEILMHPVVKIHRLAHIEDLVLFVVHDVHAGALRQLFQFFLDIKHCG